MARARKQEREFAGHQSVSSFPERGWQPLSGLVVQILGRSGERRGSLSGTSGLPLKSTLREVPGKLSASKLQRVLRFAIAMPIAELAISETLHCDLRVRWKVASDLRYRVAMSEPFFLRDFPDLPFLVFLFSLCLVASFFLVFFVFFSLFWGCFPCFFFPCFLVGTTPPTYIYIYICTHTHFFLRGGVRVGGGGGWESSPPPP